MIIQLANTEHLTAIYDLYKKVASTPGFLARLEDEINLEYITENIKASLENGLCLIAIENFEIIAEIHGYSAGIYCFSHVIGNITIAVDPNFQGDGIGRKLFSEFIEQIKANLPQISRLELMVRESNSRAIRMYQSLGFEIEGELRNRILNKDKTKESDLILGLVF